MILAVLVASLVTFTLYFVIAPILLWRARVPLTTAFNVLMVGFMAVFILTNILTVFLVNLLFV